MNTTINKDTSIEELLNFLGFNNRTMRVETRDSLIKNFNTVEDIYNISYQEFLNTPDIAEPTLYRLATVFICCDLSNCRNSKFITSLLTKRVADTLHANGNDKTGVLYRFINEKKFLSWVSDLSNNEAYFRSLCHITYNKKTHRKKSWNYFPLLIEYLDELNKKSKQETNVTPKPQEPNEKASRLFEQLLEIWNDDVEQQVEDIINQSR